MGGAAAIDSGEDSPLGRPGVGRRHVAGGRLQHDGLCGRPAADELAGVRGPRMAGAVSARQEAASPFWMPRPRGMCPAKASACCCLKRLSDAQRDGDRIHAIIRSIGAAHHQSAGQSVEMAVERSLRAAAVEPVNVALLEIDGCGIRGKTPNDFKPSRPTIRRASALSRY